MSKILENAKKHFKDKLGTELNKLNVSEWDCDVYYKNAYSFATESKIIQLQSKGDTVEALVESIISKALTQDGKPMFSRFDHTTLMHETDPAVLIKIATVLNTATSEYKVEEVEKN